MANVKSFQEEAEDQATVLLPVVLVLKALANWENFVVKVGHVKCFKLIVNTVKKCID